MNATFSLAFNYISDSHLEKLIKTFDKCEDIFVCAKSPAISSRAKVVGGYGIEFKQTLLELLENCKSDWLLFLNKAVHIRINPEFVQWIESLNVETQIVSYSAYEITDSASSYLDKQPLIDYQPGSVKDDFDFGPLLFLNVRLAREILNKYPALICDDQTAFYALRLAASLQQLPRRFQSFSYTAIELAKDDQHAQHFAYASAAGASQQKAFEKTFIEFSKIAGFHRQSEPQTLNYNSELFDIEASVIIPVKNRSGKVEHAVRSALNQKTDFSFNVIVIDNHSDDGTTESLKELSKQYKNLVHLVPQRTDLGIGGCWQLAIEDKRCGKFCAQLDSDDIYINENVLQKIVQRFYDTNAGAVVGSYLLVDRDLNPIPPGAIEHREWNDISGYTNILRINGLGAPRAYYTPVIREIGFPNVSYGEDYSAMLGISRKYKISRIYEHLYLCRRWEGNSDAQPGIEKMNRFNFYKDSLRTAEIEKRKAERT